MPSIALHINVTVQRLFSEVPASARRQPNCASAELPFLRSRLPAYTVEYSSFPQPLSGAVLFEPNYRTLFFRCQYLFCTFNTFARIFRGELRLYLYDYYRCPVSILRRKPELPRSVLVWRVVVHYRCPVSKLRKNRNCLALREPGALWFITGFRIETAKKTVIASLSVRRARWVPFKIRARSAHNNYSSFIIHY